MSAHRVQGPWGWVNWGGEMQLAEAHGHRHLLLTRLRGKKGVYTTGAEGLLIPVTGAEPAMLAIGAVPELLAVAEAVVAAAEAERTGPSIAPLVADCMRIVEAARAAISKARGGVS